MAKGMKIMYNFSSSVFTMVLGPFSLHNALSAAPQMSLCQGCCCVAGMTVAEVQLVFRDGKR
jgi:hypothetical protein